MKTKQNDTRIENLHGRKIGSVRKAVNGKDYVFLSPAGKVIFIVRGMLFDHNGNFFNDGRL